ncbi:hypothetical protein PVK06_017059 [Gossypium arboreum]|uniref:Uncharacterized protein n=1 Tax=Gossypium arboreum TaxID=29729 RepID=A0ABR0Q256_GOSAR|nr:hypothetical protein PVK06_017059 [Gossypium arboreum]
MVLNPEALVFHQQDKLIASLLSTIDGPLLLCFTYVQTSSDVWTIANRQFAAIIGAKLSHIKHDLHSIKKVITLASFSSELLPMRRLLNILLEFESRQRHMVLETPYHSNLLKAPFSGLAMVNSSRTVCSSHGGRG